MQSNSYEKRNVYKLGKSIKGIGSWLLWGTILCPFFAILAFVFNLLSHSLITIEIFSFLFFGFIIAIVIFEILSVIYAIIMIVRGFLAASSTGIKRFGVFSLLYILSYFITIIMYGVLFYLISHQIINLANNLISTILTRTNPISYFQNVFNLLGNISINVGFMKLIPFIGVFIGYIMRIIAWGILKSGIKHSYSYDSMHKASSGCTLMIVSMIFLGIFNTVSVISSFLPFIRAIIILILAIPYLIFYILEVAAFISIGKGMKNLQNKTYGYEPTLSGYSSQQGYNPNQYGYNNHNQQNQYSTQQGYNPNQYNHYSSQSRYNTASKPNDGSKYCPECGSSISPNDRICKFCGNNLRP